MTSEPELLAPAGNWECVRAAIANGADAVYFGLPRFNARLRADNFTEEELPEVVRFCHRHGVKAYVAFNTLVFTDELPDAADYLRTLNRAQVDALIVQDIGLVRLAREITPELPIHASTQMTITSPEGAQVAHRQLGIDRVVLARELSLRELEKFNASQRDEAAPSPLEWEVFVHGALCVAYSGQCLTSESLGRRSANRGECAQACRMPYELIVDGAVRDLGDRRYLLSPQDLAAVDEIPALLERGVVSFKIEGRLKTPEYVAAVCQVYRKAIDAALAGREWQPERDDRYQMEMTFSRGLYSGWLHGVNHQELVPARFGKKRGPLVGLVKKTGRDFVEIDTLQIDLKPGDGVVFDTGGDTNQEQGGRLYAVHGNRLTFGRGHLDFRRIAPGHHVWKTDDPALNARLRKSFAGSVTQKRPERLKALTLQVSGKVGEPLVIEVTPSPAPLRFASRLPLQSARTAPLTTARLAEHLGRFGGTPFRLETLDNRLEGEVILPIAELNRVRRELLFALEAEHPRAERDFAPSDFFPPRTAVASPPGPALHLLCRTQEQLDAILAVGGVDSILVDFEDIRRYRDAVGALRAFAEVTGRPAPPLFLATPRIQKAGEQGFFKLIEKAGADGVLIRNLGAIEYFRESPLRKIGDFSLNIANPLSARFFMERGLERITVSYDLNLQQVQALLNHAPPEWFELTLHQHMPMFHMEHCVFAAFLSKGTSFLDCGRPCDHHRVHLRDRVGVEHPLRADVGCRNTLFNAVPQTGASFFETLPPLGLRHYRVELLEEDAAESTRIVQSYRRLLSGAEDGRNLWRKLSATSQLGVTHGTYREDRAGAA
ncbi:MAG TPA: DUF3656 domain-containing protein [Chthoniobacteraceae bacterium]|nr:DUF3656 domain-containing protein [Chthoniobacteraceae bacterium]